MSYEYYPKDVSAVKQKDFYNNSDEHQNLINRLLPENSLYNQAYLDSIWARIETDFGVKIEDHTLPTWLDRCHNWQFPLESNISVSQVLVMCLNISKVTPIFTSYILEVEYDNDLGRLKYSPRRSKPYEKHYAYKLQKLNAIVFSKLKIDFFPRSEFNYPIENLSFQDIELGNFTLFNAFFLNGFTTRYS